MDFLDPRAEPLAPPEPYDLRVDLKPGTTVALLANGYPDSVAFLDHVEAALTQAFEGLSFRRYDKGNASIVVGDQMLDDITDQCGALIAAYGH